MRRQDKVQNQAKKEELKHHKVQLESERGWAGQHGQHPETEEEKDYRPTDSHTDPHKEDKESGNCFQLKSQKTGRT